MKKPVRLIPFVCGAGAQVAGAELGALDLYSTGLSDHLRKFDLDVEWQEDPENLYKTKWGKISHDILPPLGSDERKQIVLWHCRNLCKQVSGVIEKGMTAVTIGGDHSMAMGSIAGVAKAKKSHGRIGVIWIDAHADINTFGSSSSKAIHGMPVASLLGMDDQDFACISGDEQAVLNPEHIVYLGLRDVDEDEKTYMRGLGIKGYSVDEARFENIEKIISTAIDELSKETDCLVLSIDIDGFDPSEAPSTGTRVAGGFVAAEILPVLEKVVAPVDFSLVEIAEYNPTLGDKDKTSSLIKNLLSAALA